MGSEWALVFFTAFVGLGAGTFIAVGASEWWGFNPQARGRGAVMALIALAVGGLSSVLHLGHPERIFGALGHPTSGIFMESLTIGLTGLCVIAYLIALRRNAPARSRKIIITAGAVLAALLAFAVGDTYVMSSRPAWNTLILPLVYLASAGVLGCFGFRVLMASHTGGEMTTGLRSTTLTALSLQAALIIAYLVAVAVAPYPQDNRSAIRVLTGDLAPLFWIGIVLVGLLVPLALTLKKVNVPISRPAAISGLLCVFVGAVAFRLLMFNLGSSLWHFF